MSDWLEFADWNVGCAARPVRAALADAITALAAAIRSAARAVRPQAR